MLDLKKERTFKRMIRAAMRTLGANKYLAFAFFQYRRMMDFRITRVASSLTYTTLLAMVPFLTVALVLVRAFPMFGRLTDNIYDELSAFLLPDGATAVKEYIQEFVDKAGKLTAIGGAMLFATSIMLMYTIEQTFNSIWNSKQRRPLLFRLLVYWTTLTLGPVVVLLASATFSLAVKPTNFSIDYPFATSALYFLSTGFLAGLAAAAMFRLVPCVYVPMRHALFGGMLSGFSFEALRRLFGVYVKNFNGYEFVYGAFAAVPLFLVWIYCLWLVILMGAVFTASLSHWKGEGFRRHFARDPLYDQVVYSLCLLREAQIEGRLISVAQFPNYMNIGFDDLGNILAKLMALGYIVESDRGYALLKDADRIYLDELFEQFVYRPSDPNRRNPVAAELAARLTPLVMGLNMSLQQFIDSMRDGKVEFDRPQGRAKRRWWGRKGKARDLASEEAVKGPDKPDGREAKRGGALAWQSRDGALSGNAMRPLGAGPVRLGAAPDPDPGAVPEGPEGPEGPECPEGLGFPWAPEFIESIESPKDPEDPQGPARGEGPIGPRGR